MDWIRWFFKVPKKKNSVGTTFGFIASRYNLRSLVVLVVVICMCSFVGIRWWQLLLRNIRVVDWVLVSIWVVMTALLSWDVRFKKDIPLFVAAAAGGLVIEWWGTNTELWQYFTGERPPPWIILAWPVATLSTDRIAFVMARFFPKDSPYWRIPYWVLLPVFFVWMTHFIWPTIDLTASRIVLVLMVFIVLSGRSFRRDTVLFVAGSFLGIFLEYWGTSRHCWTYYTGEAPPFVAVVAHGFAAVAFARALSMLEWCLAKMGLPLSVAPRTASAAEQEAS